MAFAIHIQTESSDHYVYAFDGQPTQIEILKHIKKMLGSEFKYIADYQFDATYEIDFKMK